MEADCTRIGQRTAKDWETLPVSHYMRKAPGKELLDNSETVGYPIAQGMKFSQGKSEPLCMADDFCEKITGLLAFFVLKNSTRRPAKSRSERIYPRRNGTSPGDGRNRPSAPVERREAAAGCESSRDCGVARGKSIRPGAVPGGFIRGVEIY